MYALLSFAPELNLSLRVDFRSAKTAGGVLRRRCCKSKSESCTTPD